MANCPTPIVIVSASFNRGELFKTFDALSAGAVDVLEKPLGDELDGGWERKLISTVKVASRIKVITHIRPRASPAPPPSEPEASPSRAGYRLVVVGASTGGPSAMVGILRALEPRFPLPMLLVIHIGQPFAPAFSEWLDGQTPMRVSEAQDGERAPQPGESRLIIAPADRHLLLVDGHLRLSDAPERHSCRPSVDMLFESIAEERSAAATTIACLLTGMGKDGAAGTLAIKRAGGTTLVQDEASSVVYGMPREAALLGAATQILPLDRFAPTLGRLAAERPARLP
jgi:two-component system chemotaxis response regulator CheB